MRDTTTASRIARGSWQQELWGQLTAGRTISSPSRFLTGKAASYSGKYQESFSNLLARAQAAGYTVIRTPGKCGGEWSATYRLYQDPRE